MPSCPCEQPWIAKTLAALPTLAAAPEAVLCTTAANCRALCDEKGPACAGVRVSGAYFCELLSSVGPPPSPPDAAAEIFLKQDDTACTHAQDYEKVGTLTVTTRAETEQRYVVAPEEVTSIEVVGTFDEDMDDRIMVIDACGTCGVTAPSNHVLAGSSQSTDAWENFPPMRDQPIELHGSPGCPCLDVEPILSPFLGDGGCKFGAGGKCLPWDWSDIVGVGVAAFNPIYGGACVAWDLKSDFCANPDGTPLPDNIRPPWCEDQWCYVDPDQCYGPAAESLQETMFFPGLPLTYTYKTCEDQRPLEEYSLCELVPASLPDGGCATIEGACMSGCGVDYLCLDVPEDTYPSFGIDSARFAANGGCEGAIIGSADEDGHHCTDPLKALLIGEPPADAPGDTLCHVCCGTCALHGHYCPPPPPPPGADVCIAQCLQAEKDRIVKEIKDGLPAIGRRRRASTLSTLRFSPIRVQLAGRYKVCFCDETLGNCDGRDDFSVELGTLHASGVSCLLEDAGLRTTECGQQEEGGLRCVAP